MENWIAMKQRSWKDQKLYLYQMIKQVSDFYGSDDAEWIRNYAKLVIEEHKDDFSRAIICFEDLLAQTKYARRLGST